MSGTGGTGGEAGETPVFPHHSFQAVIFDCDGVLIDSEIISAKVWAHEVSQHGYTLTPETFAVRYAGRPAADIARLISKSGPRPLPPDFARETDDKVAALYADQLEPVEGIEALLASLQHTPVAVASSSAIAKLRQGLVVTNLLRRFGPHVYSAEQVPRGKPAPDLFLYAAESLDVAPALCLVIEDSLAGVTAARAAGMTAIGFTGTALRPVPHAEALRQVGAAVTVHRHEDMLAAMRDLDARMAR